jgi:hypothetical protein
LDEDLTIGPGKPRPFFIGGMMAKETLKWCQWPRCRNESTVVYLGKGLCDKHWKLIAEMEIQEAHKKLDIKQGDQNGKHENSEGRKDSSGQMEQEQKEL